MEDVKSTGQSVGTVESSRKSVVVLGLESVGKSSLLSGLTGRFAESSAGRGLTLVGTVGWGGGECNADECSETEAEPFIGSR